MGVFRNVMSNSSKQERGSFLVSLIIKIQLFTELQVKKQSARLKIPATETLL